MKSMMRVTVFIALGTVAMVSLHAQLSGMHPTKAIVQPKRLSEHELTSTDQHTADVLAIEQVWAAYAYYNDTHNGPGMASLFTEDAVWRGASNHLGSWVGGGGCRLTGRKDIATFFGYNRTGELPPDERDGIPFPANSHHMNTNMLVKVSDDGKTAMITSTLLYTATTNGGASRMANDGKGSRIAASGTYRNFFRKTPEGWLISEVNDIGDPHPNDGITTADRASGPACDADGPIPRPSAAMPATVSQPAQQTNYMDGHPTKDVVQPPRLSKNELFSQDHTADVLAVEQVWAAYAYYNDSHNGLGMASLFTEDAVWRGASNHLGQLKGGGGCRLTGRKQIATFFGYNRTGELPPDERDGLPFPATSHHMNSNMLVKVSDDGKTAMITSTLLYTATTNGGASRMANDGKGSRIADSGTYRNFFRKTPEGWKIAEVNDVGDPHPNSGITTADRTNGGPACDAGGPVPRPSADMPTTVSSHDQLAAPHPTKEVVQPTRVQKDDLFSQDHTADVLAIEQVWAAYAYYNDTHNGPGMASLFTEDAVSHGGQNNLGRWESGGSGCRLVGHKQIATFFGYNRTGELGPENRDGLPFPATSHHMNTNMLVKVSDDGKTAMITSTLLYTATTNGNASRMANDGKGSRIGDSGTYRNFFRKTSDGWKISERYDIGDPHPNSGITTADRTSGPACGPNGPIPGPSAVADAIK